jgi:hypothetical protein
MAELESAVLFICEYKGIQSFLIRLIMLQPVPVAARSKAYVCDRWPAEIVGSNHTSSMDVLLLWVSRDVR